MKKVLIVVDMQNDFINGSLGTKEAQQIVPNVINKIEEYKKNKYQIIFTRDTHYENYLETNEGRHLPVKHCIFGTDGWNIYDGLEDGCEKSWHIDKPSFGWKSWGWALRDVISEIDEIEIAGLCSDICVISNAIILKTLFPEMNITVDASCCAGVTKESHKAALLVMKMCQIDVIGE